MKSSRATRIRRPPHAAGKSPRSFTISFSIKLARANTQCTRGAGKLAE